MKEPLPTPNFKYQVIFVLLSILLAALFACNPVSQPQDITLTPGYLDSSDTDTLTLAPLPYPLWQWNGIIPGESTPDDVEAILGPPDNTHRWDKLHFEPDADMLPWRYWIYNKREIQGTIICRANCIGKVRVVFEEGIVRLIQFVIGQDSELMLRDVILELGDPELFGGLPYMSSNKATINYYFEQGLALDKINSLASTWGITNPGKGIQLIVGPNYVEGEDSVRSLHPTTEFPPINSPAHHVKLFAPMSV